MNQLTLVWLIFKKDRCFLGKELDKRGGFFSGFFFGLYKIIFPKIRLQDRIFYRSENESDIFGVGSTSKVGVDDFFGVWIKLDEHPENELARGRRVAIVAGILGEICPQVTRLNLLLQKVFLVQK